jgi:hypothetical protein
MWKSVAFMLVLAAILTMISSEILRSVIHSKRKSKDGLGGTQDIAMLGTIICGVLLIAALVCGILSFFL